MSLNCKIFLASKSPRRKMLIEALGFECQTVFQDIAEDYPEDISLNNVPEYLALKKAESVELKLNNNEFILASDTIVLMNNKIFHKPVDRNDAIEILSHLSGKTHQVITGVSIIGNQNDVSFSETSEVTFNELSVKEIEYYVDNFKPYDKAGAYAIQEWIGHAIINKINGNYNNIVGLPSSRVYLEIKKIMKSN